MNHITVIFTTIIFSSLTYLFLHKKTRIDIRYLYTDNILVIALTIAFASLLSIFITDLPGFYYTLFSIFIIGSLVSLITMIRFWRTPYRTVTATSKEIISPADGKVIYIKEINKDEVPVSIKNAVRAELNELMPFRSEEEKFWLIGINMTLFDVHKNCSPIDGMIIYNQHFKGKFLSLKNKNALIENERNTYIIQNMNIKVGVVQTASRLVRRIDSYKKVGEKVKKGEWIGMIRFGSQVDLAIPFEASLKVNVNQQVYALKSIIAEIP
jgi:phosphatidylserine decarboxylase